jgi:hypothetical protein
MSRRHRKYEKHLDHAAELIRMLSAPPEDWRRARRRHRERRRRGRSLIGRLFKAWLRMALAAIAIVVVMLATRRLLGPLGSEGMIVTPLLVLGSWIAILYATVFRKPALPPPASTQTNLALLPSQTDEWLDAQRAALPAEAQGRLDSITQRLESLVPQVQGLDPQQPRAAELRGLLAEELPELVRSYQRIPRALRSQPLHEGPSPERRLLEGLATVDEQLARVHEELAQSDLHALATQQRYLELKYKRDGKE